MNSVNSPTVTVLIPTYNRGSLLTRAVDSVLDQTYKDFELIIVDDCSTDNTKQVVEQIMEQDSRVRYIRNEKNLHAQEARNRGARQARGIYIASLDDDDLWLPQKLELQMQLIDKYAVVGCDHAYDNIPEDGTNLIPADQVKYNEKSIEEFGFTNRGFSPSKMLVRKEHFLDIGGYDSSIPGPEGLDFFYRLVSKFGKAAWVDKILCIHYTNHGMPRITDRMIEACEREFEKNKHFRSQLGQRFRMAEIDLMKLKGDKGGVKKVRHLLDFFTRIDPQNFSMFFRLLFLQLFIKYPPLSWLLPIYRRIKYR